MRRKWMTVVLMLLLLTAVGTNAFGQDRVLTIYLAGTGMTWNDHDANNCPWNKPELLATLYEHHDNSVAIEHDAFDIFTGVWPPLPIQDDTATHFKYFVNGAGTSSWTLGLTPKLRFVDFIALLGSIDPDLGTRTWHNIEAEALNGLITLLNKHPYDQVILNVVGFSRGGISAMRVAHHAAEYSGVKKINILAFDPVPGGLDPIATHGEYFVLDPKVNQYVGIYSEDERSYPFEPVIPEKTPGSDTKLLLLRTPGSHETMMGNQQTLGHSVGLNLSTFLGEVDAFKTVSEVSQVIVEQLLTSVEWGQVPLTINENMWITGGVDTKAEFAAMANEMWAVFSQDAPWPYTNYHNAIQQTGFLGAMYGGRDLCYTLLNKGHELRVPTPLSVEKRFVFVGDQRRPLGGWVWGYCGLGAWVLNSEVVYWLEDRAPRIGPSTWDTLQTFRGSPPADETAPVPNMASLPAFEGQCSATIINPPNATDNVDGLIEGTTTDPLSYSEQGEYTVTWTFTDSSGNTSTQTQQILVQDTLGPLPDSDDPATDNVIEGLPTIHGQCFAEVVDVPTATDNCSGTVVGQTSDPLIFREQGVHTVTWVYTDQYGNETTQVQTIVVADTTAPVIEARLSPVFGDDDDDDDESTFRVEYTVNDDCDPAPAIAAFIEVGARKIEVKNGQLLQLEDDDDCEYEWDDGALEIEAPMVKFIVEATDASGNEKRFQKIYRLEEDEGEDDDEEDDS